MSDSKTIRIGSRDYKFYEEISKKEDESDFDFNTRVERRRNNIRIANMPSKTYVKHLSKKSIIYLETK